MKVEDMVLISVDDHVVEPPSLSDYFRDHVPAKFRDRVPRVIRRDDGTDAWLIEGKEISTFGLNAVQGRPREDWGSDPASFDQVRPGTYDIHERIKDMSAGGILSSMNFPSFPGFSGRLFAASADKDLALAVLQAYNDWHIDEWAGSYPGRMIPMALPVLWDAEECAREVRRVARKGCHSLTFTENPATLGYPSFHSEHWDPLWRAVCEENVVVSIHLGSSGKLSMTAPDAPVDVMITLQPMNICQAAADLLWSRVVKNYPDIKFALSEGGTGWIPYFLDRIDRTYDSSWPQAPEELAAVARDVPDAELNKITYENAMRWYSFDPFKHRAKEQSTVGALRAETRGHDVSIQSRDTGRFEKSVGIQVGRLAQVSTA